MYIGKKRLVDGYTKKESFRCLHRLESGNMVEYLTCKKLETDVIFLDENWNGCQI